MIHYLAVRDERREHDKKVTILTFHEYDDCIAQKELLEELDFASVSIKMMQAVDFVDLKRKFPNFM